MLFNTKVSKEQARQAKDCIADSLLGKHGMVGVSSGFNQEKGYFRVRILLKDHTEISELAEEIRKLKNTGLIDAVPIEIEVSGPIIAQKSLSI